MDTVEARHLLVGLLDVRIGEVDSEALISAISMQGESLEPELARVIKGPVRCELLRSGGALGEEWPLECKSRDERDRLVRWLLEHIRDGVRIEYVL
jgi:hypothetical protein